MASQRELVKVEAARKGQGAIIAAVLTLAAVGLTLPLQVLWLSILVFVTGLAWTAVRTVEWLRYRGENGLRF